MASKGTTIKDALLRFEEKNECKANETKCVRLYAQVSDSVSKYLDKF